MSSAPPIDELLTIPLFQELSQTDIERLRPLLHQSSFPAGSVVMTTDQPGEVAYIVRHGTLKIYVDNARGNNVILALLGPGEVVGEMSLVDQGGRSASVVTMDRTEMLWLDRNAFWQCLRTMPLMGHNLTRILARRLRLANALIHSLATLDVYGRVAYQIVALADAYGQPVADGIQIPLRLTQNDLADAIGASRVRVNQVLTSFRDQELISVDRHFRITVHQPATLTEFCQ